MLHAASYAADQRYDGTHHLKQTWPFYEVLIPVTNPMEKDPTPLPIMTGILILGSTGVKQYFWPSYANETLLR
ncbi:MAG TPA: hypothetical protein VGP19_08510 [Candidatus Acidoferrales bacterium]|jgi:hypothetical protein|nr:hypothetical protein [Candidatus Acidoferrales bacterium]